MVLCYWGKCTCPDRQPCQEHHGNHCGLWNRVQVRQLSQVVDGVTRDADAAIARMTRDESDIDASIRTLEQRKRELEDTKRDLEGAFDNARSPGARRAAIAQGRRAEARVAVVQQELLRVTDDLDAMTQGWQGAFGRLSVRLVIPYTDPAGYCTCYADKQARLAAVNTQITTAMTQWSALKREFNLYRSNLANIVRTPLTIAAGLGLWAYIIFGIGAAFWKAIFVILLVIAILVIALAIRIAWIVKRMAALSRQVQGFQLTYYRMQSILTCIQLAGDPPPGGSSWWEQQVLEQLPPGALPPPGDAPPDEH